MSPSVPLRAASKASDMVTSIPQATWRQPRVIRWRLGSSRSKQVARVVAAASEPQKRELARQATNAVSQQVQLLAQQLGQTAHGMAQNLQKPTQQAVESVQATASRAASTIADRSRSAAEDVAGRAEQAKTALVTPLQFKPPEPRMQLHLLRSCIGTRRP